MHGRFAAGGQCDGKPGGMHRGGCGDHRDARRLSGGGGVRFHRGPGDRGHERRDAGTIVDEYSTAA